MQAGLLRRSLSCYRGLAFVVSAALVSPSAEGLPWTSPRPATPSADLAGALRTVLRGRCPDADQARQAEALLALGAQCSVGASGRNAAAIADVAAFVNADAESHLLAILAGQERDELGCALERASELAGVEAKRAADDLLPKIELLADLQAEIVRREAVAHSNAQGANNPGARALAAARAERAAILASIPFAEYPSIQSLIENAATSTRLRGGEAASDALVADVKAAYGSLQTELRRTRDRMALAAANRGLGLTSEDRRDLAKDSFLFDRAARSRASAGEDLRSLRCRLDARSGEGADDLDAAMDALAFGASMASGLAASGERLAASMAARSPANRALIFLSKRAMQARLAAFASGADAAAFARDVQACYQSVGSARIRSDAASQPGFGQGACDSAGSVEFIARKNCLLEASMKSAAAFVGLGGFERTKRLMARLRQPSAMSAREIPRDHPNRPRTALPRQKDRDADEVFSDPSALANATPEAHRAWVNSPTFRDGTYVGAIVRTREGADVPIYLPRVPDSAAETRINTHRTLVQSFADRYGYEPEVVVGFEFIANQAGDVVSMMDKSGGWFRRGMPSQEARSRLEYAADGLRTAGWSTRMHGVKVFDPLAESAAAARSGAAARRPAPALEPLEPDIPPILQPRSRPPPTAALQEAGHVEARFGVALERHLQRVAPDLMSKTRREYLWILRNAPEAQTLSGARAAAEAGRDGSLRWLKAVAKVTNSADAERREAYQAIHGIVSLREEGAASSLGQYYRRLVEAPSEAQSGTPPLRASEAMRRLQAVERYWDEYFERVREEMARSGRR